MSSLNVNGVVPVRATMGAAGYDLKANKDMVIQPGANALVPTGTYLQIPNEYYGKIEARSSLAYKHQIYVEAGVIDSDYRGEIGVVLQNASNKEFVIKSGDRIAQIIFQRYYVFEMVNNKLENTDRGDGGFGSTGK